MKKPNNITKNDWKLLQKKYKNLDKVIEKLENNYPVQYLIGYVDFFDNKIKVNENVLIPRFETETLVEKTLQFIEKLEFNKISILEIGTGSGCISIALKSENRDFEITAIDKSRKALKVARKNAKINKCKVNFINKDIFKYNIINKFDVLISNPPYLKDGEKLDSNIEFEPKIALFGGKDGLDFYRQIFKATKKSLNKKYLVAFEIEETNASKLKKIAKESFPDAKIIVEKDLAEKDRYLFIHSE